MAADRRRRKLHIGSTTRLAEEILQRGRPPPGPLERERLWTVRRMMRLIHHRSISINKSFVSGLLVRGARGCTKARPLLIDPTVQPPETGIEDVLGWIAEVYIAVGIGPAVVKPVVNAGARVRR